MAKRGHAFKLIESITFGPVTDPFLDKLDESITEVLKTNYITLHLLVSLTYQFQKYYFYYIRFPLYCVRVKTNTTFYYSQFKF